MHANKFYTSLAVLAGLSSGLAQDVVLDDTYFYGESPPMYPSPNATGIGDWGSAYAKARELVSQMTIEEKVNMTAGTTVTTGCSGHIPAIPRLGFPGICVTDAGNGVRNTDFVNSWPSGLHVGASWNKELAWKRATAMGKEALKKGVNTLLGPVVGPAFRLPTGGRNWEGFAADPYLAGALVHETIDGIQKSGVMACHLVGNEQEVHRLAYGNVSSVSSNIDDATLHEFYLWPFQDAIHAGAASVMCSYNRLNNSHACQNSKLLNGLLKEELGFQGFVMSDWYALSAGYQAADAGLDVVMPNGDGFWGDNLTLSVTNGSLAESRVDDMAIRVISSWYLLQQNKTIPVPGAGMPIDLSVPHKVVDARDPADKPILFKGAVEGHVLVKNTGILPFKSPKLLYLAGYSAQDPSQTSPNIDNNGFTLGYESSHDMITNYSTSFSGNLNIPGPAVALGGTIYSGGGSGAVTPSVAWSPFFALVNRALDDGTKLYWDFTSAEPQPDSSADACIVFGNSWATESVDRPGVRDDYTDTMIESVAANCSNTIVVLHNAGPRIVDSWVDHPNISAVIFAHLPGQDSGRALVSLLYGDENFSGRMPYSLPKNESDYDGLFGPTYPEAGKFEHFPQIDFTEGVYIDYRRFDASGVTPRYEFGYGLSYTTFNYSGLKIARNPRIRFSKYPVGAVIEGGQADLWDIVATVTAQVSNTGTVDGQEVAQLYVTIPGAPVRQLRGFEKVAIKASRSATITFNLTRRDLSVWDSFAQKWKLQQGTYSFHVGASSRNLPLQEHLSYGGKINLASDILNSHDDDQLVELANHLLDSLLKPFLLAGGRDPEPLTTPPSEGAGHAIDVAMTTIDVSTRAEQARLRKDCLIRDGYRCTYTGSWDHESYKKGHVQPPPRQIWGHVDCAHIIPFALGSFDDTDAVQTRNKVIIWFAIHRYFPETKDLIDARSINQRGNALTLDVAVYRWFGAYELTFLPQGMNKFRAVKLVDVDFTFQSKSGTDVVEFFCSDRSIPMPEPAFLQVHYTISQILQVSGFGDAISRALDEYETGVFDYHGLDPSGGTDVADLLSKMMLINVNVDSRSGAVENFHSDDHQILK
ncbi:glycoside hydrolase family 3 protein [Ophiostoma piceae UAMH 11346]|uniref:beta-glucosidase n=1 Tax=Ophiostoma piceae (strain UAMH 11346) TaxID=1262450 RepID=S3D8P9_OPHP1|nr:glycoside hydrolase family 3 protein [Ophiostoma piceae UAMH 11346]